LRITVSIALFLVTKGLLGQYSYDYIAQPNSATSSVFGGRVVSLTHSDLGVWMDNPALLDSSVHQKAAVSINPYFVDIARYAVTASINPKWVDQLAIGLIYNHYGQFDYLDDVGNAEGSFTSRSYLFQVGASKQRGLFTLGASTKLSGINLESSSAMLALFDIGGVFRAPGQELVVGMSIRNFGWVINESLGFEQSDLPFDVVLGLTFKPRYMPFRITLTAYDLPRLSEEVVPEELARSSVFAPVFRYVNPGVSLVVGDLMELQLGYNYRLNETLRLNQGGFGAGWSFGTKLLLDRWQVMLSRNTYQAAGGTTFITLQTDYSKIKNIF
jgi:hypothetical protein